MIYNLITEQNAPFHMVCASNFGDTYDSTGVAAIPTQSILYSGRQGRIKA